MTGFSRAEVRIIALAARHHRKVEPKRGRGPDAPAVEGRLAAACATSPPSCASPTRSTARTRGWCARCAARSPPRTVEVRIDADGDPELEIWAARRKGDLFEELAERKLRFAVDQVREREERPRRAEPTTPDGRGAASAAPRRGGSVRAPGGLARRQVVVTFAPTGGVIGRGRDRRHLERRPVGGTICQCVIWLFAGALRRWLWRHRASGSPVAAAPTRPPDLDRRTSRPQPYANAACNAVDQRLAGQRQMRLYVKRRRRAAAGRRRGSPATTTVMRCRSSTDSGAAGDDDGLRARHRQDRAGPRAHRGVSGRRSQRRRGADGVGSRPLQPDRDVRRQLHAQADGRLREHAQRRRRRRDEPDRGPRSWNVRAATPIGDPGTSLAGLAISPALLAEFARTMPDEAQIWQGVNLPANFTPMMVLGNNVLTAGARHRSGAGRSGRRARVRPHRRPGSLDGAAEPHVPERDAGPRRLHRQPGRRAADASWPRPTGWAPRRERRAAGESPGAAPPGGRGRAPMSSLPPARLRAMLAGDRQATRSFVELLFPRRRGSRAGRHASDCVRCRARAGRRRSRRRSAPPTGS